LVPDWFNLLNYPYV